MKQYPVPGVRALLFDDQGRVAWIADENGELRLPGGALEGGETWVTALRARVREQCGCTVELERLEGMASPEERGGRWYLWADFVVEKYRGDLAPGLVWKKWRESPQ